MVEPSHGMEPVSYTHLDVYKRQVQMTLTTYDEALCRKLEPNVCTTSARFAALQKLRKAGIPTVVWLSPILPFINDTEENILGILRYCAEAKVKGVICFGMGVTPVSYTHLDVYKRQGALRALLREGIV